MPLFHIHALAVNVLASALRGCAIVCAPNLLRSVGPSGGGASGSGGGGGGGAARAFLSLFATPRCSDNEEDAAEAASDGAAMADGLVRATWYSAVPTIHTLVLAAAEAMLLEQQLPPPTPPDASTTPPAADADAPTTTPPDAPPAPPARGSSPPPPSLSTERAPRGLDVRLARNCSAALPHVVATRLCAALGELSARAHDARRRAVDDGGGGGGDAPAWWSSTVVLPTYAMTESMPIASPPLSCVLAADTPTFRSEQRFSIGGDAPLLLLPTTRVLATQRPPRQPQSARTLCETRRDGWVVVLHLYTLLTMRHLHAPVCPR